jgi:hypothetical protein
MFQLARRLYGARIVPRAAHLAEMVKAVNEGKYDDVLNKLKGTGEKELKKLYEEREMPPASNRRGRSFPSFNLLLSPKISSSVRRTHPSRGF